MILLFAAALATQGSLPPEDEILVIGRRFAQTAVVVGKDLQGHFTCGLTVSSGNIRLDEGLCRVASRCVIKGATNNAAVKACIDRKKPGIFADFQREWAKGIRS